MTGWGQDGPLAARAGHDINYIALTGALDAIGTPKSGPVPPMNLIGDFGGGGMLMAYGICAALLPAKISGKGTIVDASMVEGSALLMTMPYSLRAQGLWPGNRGENLLDGGAPFYGTYQTADHKWIALGAIEEPFWRELIERLQLDEETVRDRMDRNNWAHIRKCIAERIATGTREHWEAVFDGSDACFAPVLSMDEAPDHPHNRKRGTFGQSGGVIQPAPAPRYDGKVTNIPETDLTTMNYEEVLGSWSS